MPPGNSQLLGGGLSIGHTMAGKLPVCKSIVQRGRQACQGFAAFLINFLLAFAVSFVALFISPIVQGAEVA